MKKINVILITLSLLLVFNILRQPITVEAFTSYDSIEFYDYSCVVNNTGGASYRHSAFQTAIKLQNGDWILAYNRANYHGGGSVLGGFCKISHDQGYTWDSPIQICDASTYVGDIVLCQAPNSSIIAFINDNDATHNCRLSFSHDNGTSWTSRVAFPGDGWDHMPTDAKVINGVIYVTMSNPYEGLTNGTESSCYARTRIWRNADNGSIGSWVLHSDLGPWQGYDDISITSPDDKPISLDESGFINLTDSHWMMICRRYRPEDPCGNFWISLTSAVGHSYDAGVTWDEWYDFTDLTGMAFNDPGIEWFDYKNQVLILYGREVHNDERTHATCVFSYDLGETWTNRINFTESDFSIYPIIIDTGYMSYVKMEDGKGWLNWYNGSLHCEAADKWCNIYGCYVEGNTTYIPPEDEDEGYNITQINTATTNNSNIYSPTITFTGTYNTTLGIVDAWIQITNSSDLIFLAPFFNRDDIVTVLSATINPTNFTVTLPETLVEMGTTTGSHLYRYRVKVRMVTDDV